MLDGLRQGLVSSLRAPSHARRPEVPTVLTDALRPIAWIGLAFGVASTYADPDLWGHLRVSLDVLRDGRLSLIDPYSFNQDRPFIYHEWLGGVTMAAAYLLAGTTGLMALKACLAAASFLVVGHALRHVSEPWRWAGLAIVAWGVLPLVLTVRPQLWTLLFVAVLCRLLVAGNRMLWWLPILFAFWANLHGGWIVGAGVLGVWVVASLAEPGRLTNPRARRALILAAGLSMLATLATPYGADLWAFVLTTVRLGREDISEWQPIWHGPWVMWMVTLALVGVSLWTRERPPLATLLVLALLAVASARVNRIAPLFSVVAVLLLAPHWPAASAHRHVPRGRTVIDVAAVGAALLVAAYLQFIPRCLAIDRWSTPDTVAAAALRLAGAGRIVTSFDWGEYIMWHYGPRLRVSVDGRRETIYSEETLREQHAIARGDAAGLAALSTVRPEYVWLPGTSSHPTARWLDANGYRLDIVTDRSFIAVRGDLPALEMVAVEVSGCFPGP
jgi:hypothetical protein